MVRFPTAAFTVLLIALSPLACRSTSAESLERKRVLVLLPFDPSRPGPSEFLRGLQSEFQALSPGSVSLFSEHIGTAPPEPKDFEAELKRWFRYKYASRNFDAILTLTRPASEFGVPLRDELWPGTPIIFCERESSSRRPGTTGVVAGLNPIGTLRAALKLLPDTRRVALVGGSSSGDRELNVQFPQYLRQVDPALELIDLTDLPFTELLARLSKLPDKTIVFLYSFAFDRDGKPVTAMQMARLISQAANRPVFDVFEIGLGEGIVGGSLLSYGALGAAVAAKTLRILRGDPVDEIAVIRVPPLLAFDSRQLRRWNIPESRVPEGAELRFQEPSLWARYRYLIILAIAALILQAFLIAGLLAEQRRRRSSQSLLNERLRFETMAAEISASVANLPAGQVDATVERSLEQIVEFFGLSRATLWRFDIPENAAYRICSAPQPVPAHLPSRLSGEIPYVAEQITAGRDVRLTRIENLPAQGKADFEMLRALGIRSILMIPLFLRGASIGGASFCSNIYEIDWNDEVVTRLRTLCEILAAAIARRDAELQVYESEVLNRAALASLSGYVAIVDRNGAILRGNANWYSVADIGLADATSLSVGQNYLDAWEGPSSVSGEERDRVLQVVRAVLSGERKSASVEYTYHRESTQRWVDILVQQLESPGGGAIITHLDITAKKRAEIESVHNLETISHMNRVAGMGELAASLAHEINQPLTAIVSNAEAALAFTSHRDVPLEEIRGALADVIEDGQRAGNIISNMRALLRKGTVKSTQVDLGSVVRDAQSLVKTAAILRRTAIQIDLPDRPATVIADSVQLQQVILNLIANGIDAMDQIPPENRHLTVRVLILDQARRVVLEVADSGKGLPKQGPSQIFDPFFTTKPDGLGMGLSITRSILNSIGGRIWAENLAAGGAIFRVDLPYSAAQPAEPLHETADRAGMTA